MGGLFTSFDAAWEYFLERREPLEDFFVAEFDDRETDVDVWLIVPPPEVKRAALAITTTPAPPDELRAVLEPLRETFLGRQRVEESIRVSFPFSRERLFEPWTVHERVPVGR